MKLNECETMERTMVWIMGIGNIEKHLSELYL